MSFETKIHLNRFKPRSYQIPIMDALENKGYKKIIACMPRRAGKDMVCFNLMIRQALQRVGTYYYILPTHVQARQVMFDAFTSDGQKILDYIPPELIAKIQSQEMKVTLKNGSIIQFCGSNKFDRLRGTNPVGIVFSEFSYQHPQVYPTLRPVLLANNGWAIFISTPFGENHFYTLFEVAKNNRHEWFPYFLTIDDTQHMSREQIEQEIKSGEISYDMAQQEYFCDFSTGAVGAYYSKYLNKMELNEQITQVDWEPNFPVHTAWDLGMRDDTSILMFQCIGRQINIIDMYQNRDVGLEHYINVLQSKEYTWGKHIAPHDIAVRELTAGGLSRFDKAAQLGFRFTLAPNLSIIDGIESVRTALPRIYIDQRKCRPLIAALRNYRKEYDQARKVYQNKPLHDHNSHIADALRYLCTSLPKTKDSITAEELDKRFLEARYGSEANIPAFFRNERY